MKTIKHTLAAALIALLVLPAASGQAVKFTEHKLKNGLRIILSEDHSAPTYSISVTYNAGSRDERAGRTGFAHLFEHMMFQGSENVGKGEHFIIIENNGGGMNGSTNSDRTEYHETLPANQIDLGLFLEADRMRSLAINQANLDNQRATVQEEKRQRYDNQPYGRTFDTLFETAYDNFAYKHSTIGSMEDLNAATVKDVAEFFKTYYAPNNAVLSMVGDFKTNEVLAKIEKYFGNIPSQPAPPAPDMTEPKQTAERRKTIEDPLAQLARLDIAYKIPPANTPDWYALYVLGEILSTGQSSRFYQKLVRDKQVAVQTQAGQFERRGPDLFIGIVMLTPGKDPAEVEKLFYEEIERVKKEPVTDAEIAKVRIAIKRGEVEQLEGTLYRASELGKNAVYFNDPNVINTSNEKALSVTKEQIQKAAQTYLTEANRIVITTVPKPRPGGAQ
ncbi:MAG TPA: pitrilysin family protein [Terriglobia bacterium]|nr:pitrilysin family protein [Terriglobia bacterium]